MEKEAGIRRTVWLPKELDMKAEALRKQLGLGRSGFYRFAIVELPVSYTHLTLPTNREV